MRSLSVESLSKLNLLYFIDSGRLWDEKPHFALTGYEFCRLDVVKVNKAPFMFHLELHKHQEKLFPLQLSKGI